MTSKVLNMLRLLGVLRVLKVLKVLKGETLVKHGKTLVTHW